VTTQTSENKPRQWKLIGEYPITEYRCGIRAGEQVRLRKELVVRDPNGKIVPPGYQAGEVWTVLSGSAEPPVDVWLRRPDGDRHTWTDDDDFWNWFERVTDNPANIQ